MDRTPEIWREKPTDLMYDEIMLDKLEFQTSRAVESRHLKGLNIPIQLAVERVFESLVFTLRSHVLSERLASKTVEVTVGPLPVYFDVPSNPWQHCKLLWAPRWLLRWRPVEVVSMQQLSSPQTKKVLIEQFATFPTSPLKTPEEWRGVRVVRHDRASVL